MEVEAVTLCRVSRFPALDLGPHSWPVGKVTKVKIQNSNSTTLLILSFEYWILNISQFWIIAVASEKYKLKSLHFILVLLLTLVLYYTILQILYYITDHRTHNINHTMEMENESGMLFYIFSGMILTWFISSIMALDRKAIQNGHDIGNDA